MAGQCLHNKFFLLLWKNYILMKRHKTQACFEIFILPLLFNFILLLLRGNYPVETGSGTTFSEFDPKNPDKLPTLKDENMEYIKSVYILYAPNTPEFEKIINSTKEQLPALTGAVKNDSSNRTTEPPTRYECLGFRDEKSLLESYAGKSEVGNRTVAAIIFRTSVSSNDISYRLRFRNGHYEKWYTNLIYPEPWPGPRKEADDEGYRGRGFLLLQSLIDTAIIQSRAKEPNKMSEFIVTLKRYPYPDYQDDTSLAFLAHFIHMPLFMMCSFCYAVANIAKLIAHEREGRIKESMKMMGLSGWVHWSAWLARSLIMLVVPVILLTVLYKVGDILIEADGSVLFVFFLSYVFSAVTFGCLVSSICSSAHSASTTAFCLSFLTFMPYMFLGLSYHSKSTGSKLLHSLCYNTAMSYGCYIIVLFERIGTGLQWSTIGEGATLDDSMSMLHVIAMLILDGFLYLFLAIYVEAVFPGEFGAPLPWYYPISSEYWFGESNGGGTVKVSPEAEGSSHITSGFFEKEPVGVSAGIQIMGLRKVFGNNVAVDGLELNFYENQVTALLGHNGAGKTTTMSMITGLYRPTSGTALVNGFDIRTNIGAVHKSLGVCPQHDVLFDEMTVEEHLKFYCLLKGYDKPVQPEIERMLVSLKLEDKRNDQSSTLSGGMKRKLSVGLALIGESTVILLDEPTAGMDPGARRSTWDLISSERQGRTILLSTHFMDEADLLGDRIAILAHGRAICCGSSLFLKQTYGGGYHLVMVKEPNCQVNRITELLQKYIPEVAVGQNIGTELSYSLPDAKVSIFPQIFEELEKKRSELGVSSYGCSVTQMEEVFIRAGQHMESEMGEGPAQTGHSVQPSTHTIKSQLKAPSNRGVTAENSQSKVSNKQEMNNGSSKGPSYQASDIQIENPQPNESIYSRNTGTALLSQQVRHIQLRAMLVKKCIYAIRHKILFLVQAVLPITFLVLLANPSSSASSSTISEDPDLELPLDLTKFPKPITTLECSLSPVPDICSTYNEFAGLQSTVENVGRKNLEDYILKRSATKDGLVEVNSKYIIGLRVTKDTGRVGVTKKHRREAGGDVGVDLNDIHATTTENTDTGSPTEGGGMTKTKLIGFFNGQPYHAAPITLNFISNAILRNLAEKDLKLTVSNYPLPLRAQDQDSGRRDLFGARYILPLTMSFIMSLLAGSFILFPIKEREVNSKHLQLVSGVPFPIFWLGHWIFDALYYLLICILMGIVPTVLRFNGLGSGPSILLFFLTLVLYGWAAIPMAYLLSLCSSAPPTGYIRAVFIFLILGLFTVVLTETSSFQKPSRQLLFFILVPNFNLFFALDVLYLKESLCKDLDELLSQLGATEECSINGLLAYETKKGIGKYIFFLFVSGFLSYVLLFIIESKYLHFFRCRDKSSPEANSNSDPTMLEDSDVVEEIQRIRNTDIQELLVSDTMVLKDVTKYYGNFLAVDNVCLGVQHGECFGLLGVNGAGKTTTFKMLTGDISISYGDAYVTGKSVRSQLKEVQRVIGYCPQFDALIPELTGRETIQFYARLRGIPESEINDLVDELSGDLLFTEYINKPCGTYSGGNKRKLSTAISLIGNPPMVFLDEPTAGMDPVVRRHLWNTVIKVRERGCSVILTSHNMVECEALCTRLAIMVNGKFRCLGSAQHLKNKFGDGYTVIAQLPVSREEQAKPTRNSLETGRRRESINGQPEAWEVYLQPLRNFIEKHFPDCQLKDMHPCYVHYHIPMSGALSWGQLFKKMEEAKEFYQLEAYSVGQTSLEQVFLGFSKAQFNAEV